MRLRTLLATAVAGTLIAGATGMNAQATPVPSPATAGTVVGWGDDSNPGAVAAIDVPDDLTSPVAALATSWNATAAVTVDGHLRVWGNPSVLEVMDAPTNITDAVGVALSQAAGLVLHRDGTVTGWGTPALAEVPAGLRAKAIAVQAGGTGYAVTTDGTLETWGTTPPFEPPSGLTGLVDVSIGGLHGVALKADGTVVVWRYQDADPEWDAAYAMLADVPDFGSKKVTQISVGDSSTGVVLDDGSIELWGMAVPSGEPDLGSKKVVSLDVKGNAGAVTDDGTVYTWGSNNAINNNRPVSLAGQPVASIVLSSLHAEVIVTTFRELSKPTVTGTPQVGQTLTATPATLSLAPDSPATGQWYAGADAVAGQTGTTLALTQAMVGKKISYRTTATRGAETVTSTSNELGPVTLVASTTTLTVSPATGAYGAARTATATVTKTGGTPTGTVTFKVGSTQTTASLTGGKATLALPKTLAVGTQTVTASYQGDATTAASTSAAATVSVSKATSKVTAKAKATGKTKKYAKKVTITVTVKTPAGVSPAGKVTVSLKGSKKVTAKVNAKGKATVTVKKVKHGKHKATVSYAGNATVSSAKTAITVKA
jgi:hypothetical protein